MRKPSTIVRTVTSVAALTAALTAGAVPALGAGTEAGAKPAHGQQYCWLNADTDQMQCFATEAAMKQAMRGSSGTGQIAPEQSAPRGSTPQGPTPMLQTRSFQPEQQVVGRFYRDINFDGGYLMISRSGGCGSGYHSADLSDYPGWNDSVSSFVAGSGCRIGLFDNSNLTGDFLGNYRSDAYAGRLNDQASSAQFVAD
ncbi:MAG TPA: hypothetical protein VFI97_05680 [Arthrobacter sp.]|nr:hypothetical protein [Arthrobacter sp.]